MRIVVVGAGEFGVQLAAALCRQHEVTVMDTDAEREGVMANLDLRFMRGNGADPDDLRAAGADRCDVFVACTMNDDINVLACLAAKGLGSRRTMAFITRKRYVEAFRPRGAMASIGLTIDHLIWPQRTLARQIADIVRVPRAVDTASFADGRLRLIEYRLEPGDPFEGLSLAEAEVPDGVLVVGLVHGEVFTIPTGASVPHVGDKVVFMGSSEAIRRLETRFAPAPGWRQRVAVVGGGNVGYMVTERLLELGAELTVIERDAERAESLARYLPKALVLRGDGSDLELLEQERLDEVDTMVAVTTDDATNLLVSLLAKQLGVPKVITRVGQARNRRLFERVGIDTILSSRTAALSEVLNWLEEDHDVDRLATIEDRAEIMEISYPYGAAARPVQALSIPAGSLIGAVLRKQRVLVPRGDTEIRPGDHLFMVTTSELVPAVEAWQERQERGG